MASRARRRHPQPNEGLVELPALFARQNDCSGGTSFYRCAKNNFSGCCSVDPCAMDDGCPDDGDSKDPDEKVTTKDPKTTTTSDKQTMQTTMVTVTKTDSEGHATTVVTTVDGAPLPTDLPDTEAPSDDTSGGGLGGGAIAGIVVGVLALFLILAALWFWRRRKHKYTPAHTGYPPPMDANDEKFLSAADPGSATTASASTTPATLFGKLGMGSGNGSRAPTPSTPGLSNNARNSYVSSMTSSPPPGASSFAQPAVAQLDSSPVIVAEMDGNGPARPSELPATPLAGTPPRGLGVQHGRERSSGGGLPTVRENEADPRATLNSTEGQTAGRTYVNSWSSYEGPQGPQRGQ